MHFVFAGTTINEGMLVGDCTFCTKRFVNGEYKFTVHAPAGGAVEEFARKYNLEFMDS